VSGEGETVGHRRLDDGSASSALKFASAEPVSLILEGSGYWKYIPTADGVRFLTWYDYRTRFGAVGAVVDRLIFRPLIGWATAWSFDRLRLWLEDRVDPAQAVRQTLVHFASRLALAAVFAYQGAIPKLVARHADELAMLEDAGIPAAAGAMALTALGTCELALAAALLAAWCRPWPARVSLALMPIATAVVGVRSPRFLTAAFNPFALNVAVAALAAIDLLVLAGVPSASHCLRRPRSEKV